MAFQLHLTHRNFSTEELMEFADLPASAEQEEAVLAFAQQWLRGDSSFKVQTSGSTGTPKLILVSRERMQASARLTLQALGLQAGDRALLCMNANFIGGKMMIVRAITGGLPLRVVEPTANPLLQLSVHEQPLFTALVPLQLQAILKDEKSLAMLNKMKAVIIGGAPIAPALEEALQLVKAPLYSTYGMTETVSHIALRRLNGPQKQDYFQALPNIQIAVDSRGCLSIDGPVVEAAIQTNDVVEMLGQGRFRWLGRADNVINSGGIKVQAEQVEAVAEKILSHLGLSLRLLVGGQADERLGQKVVLLLEGAPLAADIEQQLLNALSQHLPKYWAPRAILYRAKFVESENGKIRRNESWQNIQ